MRIGFDAKRLFHNFTGLGNYSRTLVSNLAHQFPNNEYFLFTPSTRMSPRTAPFLSHPRMHIIQPAGFNPLWRSWRMKNQIARENIDVFHGLSHELPFQFEKKGIPSVVTIHDLIFKEYPEQYSWLDVQVYNTKFEYACRNATKIVAISEHTKLNIIKYYKIDESKIVTIYQTCDPSFYKPASQQHKEEVINKYDLPSDFLLYVGSLIERKRLLSIVQALATFPADNRPPLVVIGKGREYKQRVVDFLKKHRMENDVLFIPHITFADFPAVYQLATAMVYPSIAEGFGIPVVEALFSKIPVVTSRFSCLPEAAGPSSLQVDPNNIEELAHAISLVTTNSSLRQNMITSGAEYAQRFHESVVTKQMMELYQSFRNS